MHNFFKNKKLITFFTTLTLTAVSVSQPALSGGGWSSEKSGDGGVNRYWLGGQTGTSESKSVKVKFSTKFTNGSEELEASTGDQGSTAPTFSHSIRIIFAAKADGRDLGELLNENYSHPPQPLPEKVFSVPSGVSTISVVAQIISGDFEQKFTLKSNKGSDSMSAKDTDVVELLSKIHTTDLAKSEFTFGSISQNN